MVSPLPGLRLFTSNRLEKLAEKLADTVTVPLASPLDKEVIVVQSRGMERWVSMQLAKRHGICANIQFPYPNHFVQDIFGKVLPDLPERSPFEPEIMTWKIMKLLPTCIGRPEFKSLRDYLADPEANLKLFQLSERVADTFDQYLLFRPEMIFRWERGQEGHWQAVLWRELVKETGKGHRAEVGNAFFEALKKVPSQKHGLPEKISIFGISALPRFHIQVLEAISRFTQVNLFLMNPCREYWGDILSGWEMKKTASKQGALELPAQELYMEKGNSLLASMGKLGRDFFALVNEFECEEFESFEEPGEGTLLGCIQSDILNLRERNQKTEGKKTVESFDPSIQIHSCHSPMREMDVLYDRLLNMFEKDPNLKPTDILVMTPDIETYAPYIRAVFDMPVDESKGIPYSIADRSIRKENEVIDTFLDVLNLEGSRYGVSQVLSILESASVRRRFGLTEADLELIRKWTVDTRIRWGIDGKSRDKMGLPSFSENTWRAGLERLLLGYAMPGNDENIFQGILPYDLMEGNDTAILGKFLDLAEKLFEHTTSLGLPRTLKAWSKTLTVLLDRFFMPDEDSEKAIQAIRHTLHNLGDFQERSAFDEEIDIKVLKWHLAHCLESEGFGFGFITRGVTFCAMLPMRSIPFKVICLVGMNGDAYPRESKPLGFDLMAKHPKPGDRSRREDDRYLFLEVLLSAREQLYISYVGQSIQDNTLIPPSVLISELMDTIEQGFEMPGNHILDHIMTRHRLQAFSPEYFKKNKKLFSYSEENLKAARRMLERRGAHVPFVSGGLSVPEKEWKTVDLDDLCNFFRNPSRYLLQKRLGIYLDQTVLMPDEREPFEIKGLEKYLLENSMMEKGLAGRDLRDLFSATLAKGLLPHGTAGECLFDHLRQGVERFVEKTCGYLQGAALDPLAVDLSIGDFRLTGKINGLYPKRLMHYRYAKTKAKDYLKTWIYHLALNSIMPKGHPLISILAGLTSKGPEPGWVAFEYMPVQNSKEILGSLLEKYWEGLIKPLHFFSETSWEYAQALLLQGKPQEEALNRARNTWSGNEYNQGENSDPYYELFFRNTDPLGPEFQDMAKDVFGTLIDHQAKIKDE
jgi:exodeoxyribonuclease V gamma subunit